MKISGIYSYNALLLAPKAPSFAARKSGDCEKPRVLGSENPFSVLINPAPEAMSVRLRALQAEKLHYGYAFKEVIGKKFEAKSSLGIVNLAFPETNEKPCRTIFNLPAPMAKIPYIDFKDRTMKVLVDLEPCSAEENKERVGKILKALSSDQEMFQDVRKNTIEYLDVGQDNATSTFTIIDGRVSLPKAKSSYSGGNCLPFEVIFNTHITDEAISDKSIKNKESVRSMLTNSARVLANEGQELLPDFKSIMGTILAPHIASNKIRTEYRSKSLYSISEKMASKNVLDVEGGREQIRDLLGARIVLRSGSKKDCEDVVNSLVEAFKTNPKIQSIEKMASYRPERKYSLMNEVTYKTLKEYIAGNHPNAEVIAKPKDSGYTALHLVGTMRLNASSKDAPSRVVPFEIQITTENILKLYGPEHTVFKLANYKAAEPEYDDLRKAVSALGKDEMNAYNEYRVQAYVLQRLKDLYPKQYPDNGLLALSDSSFKEAALLDLNSISKVADIVERRLEGEESARLEREFGTFKRSARGRQRLQIPARGSNKTIDQPWCKV